MKVISQLWDDSIVPTLVEYIRIPAKSPHFDRDWQSHGYIDEAARLAAQWCERNAIAACFGALVNVKNVFVVDPDIDIFSDEQMDWALATRFQPDRDLVVADDEGIASALLVRQLHRALQLSFRRELDADSGAAQIAREHTRMAERGSRVADLDAQLLVGERRPCGE